MKNINLFLLALIVIFSIGCGNNESGSNKEEAQDTNKMKEEKPQLSAALNGKTGTVEMTREELLAMDKISIIDHQGNTVEDVDILSYSVVMVIDGYEDESLASSAALPEDLKEKIRKNIKSGSKIYFEKFKISASEGAPSELQPVVVKITE